MTKNNFDNVARTAAHLRSELQGIYPDREIEQFISMAFESVLNMSKVAVMVNKDARIEDAEQARFEKILAGLKRQEPVQYLLGSESFYGLTFTVNPAVLIPRPETEELVQWILRDGNDPASRIIDLGTGSGCIAIALKHHLPNARVEGVDISVAALNTADKNAKLNNVKVDFFQFDILEQESFGFADFDIMVSNPPYVTPSEMKAMRRNVLDHEPHNALFAPEENPLIFYRRIVDLADGHLKRGGKLYFEINQSFGPDIVQLLQDRGYTGVKLRKDLNGNDRMIRAIRP